MELLCVPPDMVHKAWPHVRPLIATAMQFHDPADLPCVEKDVLAGRMLLWVATDGSRIYSAVITELRSNAERKWCMIIACAGHQMNRWLHLIDRIEDYARAEKCSAVRIAGRKGWERVLRDYCAKHVILQKELT